MSVVLAHVFMLLLSGCSALYHPYTQTIEHKMEVLSRMPRSSQIKLDPRLLSQTPPYEHLVDDGDVLGVYIEGAPGQEGEMPVSFAKDQTSAPTIGYPTPVRSGGYVRIPQIGVLHVRGMTTAEIEEAIRRKLVVENQEIRPDKDRIHVSLMYRRSVNVMVIREEETSTTHIMAPTDGPDGDRRTGQVVNLPAFQNDVLHALLQTGGLPNNQAENAVYVFKRRDRTQPGMQTAQTIQPVPTLPSSMPFSASNIQQAAFSQIVGDSNQLLPVPAEFTTGQPAPAFGHTYSGNSRAMPGSRFPGEFSPSMKVPSGGFAMHAAPPVAAGLAPANAMDCCPPVDPDSPHPNALRIPLAVTHNEPLKFSPHDVILEDGDIIMVESRENDYFLTGGLLGGGQYSLPRNQDLDVLDAVLLADSYSRSSQVNTPTRAIGGVSVLNRDVTIGASRLVIERKTPQGTMVRFRVNLYKAMRNPDQRVIIEPGDRLYLEYTAIETVLAFFERHLLDPVTTGAPAFLAN